MNSLRFIALVASAFMLALLFTLTSVSAASYELGSSAVCRTSDSYYGYGSSRPCVTNYNTYVESPVTRSNSAFGSERHYAESPGYTRSPTSNLAQSARSSSGATNFDSSSMQYDYRGPMFERTVVHKNFFDKEISSKSGFFDSRNKDELRHHITTRITEKYVGASESVYANTQNRRSASTASELNTAANYDGGFSFGKQRVFDASEYGRESYTQPYYYRPAFDTKQGHYNWRY